VAGIELPFSLIPSENEVLLFPDTIMEVKQIMGRDTSIGSLIGAVTGAKIENLDIVFMTQVD